MKNKISRNYEEELSFGIIDKNVFEGQSSEVYTIFHLKKNPFKGIEKEVVIKDLDFNFFAGYIQGACFAKLNTEMALYNGFSRKLKETFYPGISVFPLNYSKLKDLIEYANLPRHLTIKNVK